MKKLINSVAIAYLFFAPTFSMAEHIVFFPIVVDRSQIMITIEKVGENKLKLQAVIGGMAGKIMETQCKMTDKTPPPDKLFSNVATHLNEAKMTNLNEIAFKVGLSECR